MADLERTYNIPLRREWLKSPKYRRAKKAASAVREFLQKHMKTKDVKIGKNLNEELWKHGIKNPPSMVKVTVIKEGDVAKAEIFGKKYEEAVKAEEKKEEAKGLGKVKEMLGGEEEKKEEGAEEEKPEVKKEEKPKAEEKKEVKKEAAEKPKVETKKPAEKKSAPKKEEKKPEDKPPKA